MKEINFCSSLALDSMFFIRKSNMQKNEWLPLYHHNESELLEHPIFKKHFDELNFFKRKMNINTKNINFDMSSMALILSAYTDNALESITLDNLIRIFENPNQLSNIVRQKIKNDFSSLHTFPLLDRLVNGLADEICVALKTLKANNFEHYYKQNIISCIENNITKYAQTIEKFDFKKLYNEIALLKNSDSVSQTKIYLNFFNFPFALSMYNGSFSMSYTGEVSIDFFSIIAHELMHGFADNALLEMYRKYMKSDNYLSVNHSRLLSDFGSGDEEEFVKAAEYYLCLLSGHYKKSNLLIRAKNEYEGVCPFSVIVFDLLSKESEVPRDYNQWLKDLFTSEKLPKTKIEEYIREIQ